MNSVTYILIGFVGLCQDILRAVFVTLPCMIFEGMLAVLRGLGFLLAGVTEGLGNAAESIGDIFDDFDFD